MKILVTGCSATQLGRVAKLVTVSTQLTNFLRENGYTITWRPVIPGESLDNFDKVLVWLMPFNGLGSRWWTGAAWTLYERPDAIIGLDDWKTKEIFSGIKYIDVSFARTYRLDNRCFVSETKRVEKKLISIVKTLCVTKWQFPVLCPIFPWGDPIKLRLPVTTYFPVDPSSLVPKIETIKPVVRHKRWILASIADHNHWLKRLNTKWSVTTVGHKRYTVKRIPEDVVIQMYANCWGILSPRYYHSGSGWWRARYNFSAQQKAIFYADIEEVEKMGSCYHHTINDIEEMNDHELLTLSNAQATWLSSNTWSKEKLSQAIKKIFK